MFSQFETVKILHNKRTRHQEAKTIARILVGKGIGVAIKTKIGEHFGFYTTNGRCGSFDFAKHPLARN
jgi:hypothetical protein